MAHTINYFAVTQRLLNFGEGRSWKLIEKLATDVGNLVLKDFQAKAVGVEIKKFIIPQARYVSVHIYKSQPGS